LTQHDKQQAKQVRQGKPENLADVSRRTGIAYGTLYRWVKEEGMAMEDAAKRTPMTPSEIGKHAGTIGAQKRWSKK
jgi:predicted site-specific integrase-resolvase